MAKKNRDLSNTAPSRQYGRLFLDKIAETILNLTVFFFRFVGWSLKWTVATALLFGAMAAAGYLVFLHSVQGGNYVAIPNVVNQPLSSAYEEIYRSGLQVGKTEEKLSASEPANAVIAQRPAAGKVVRTGRRVDLVVSVGPDLEEVPRYIGKSLSEVEQGITTTSQFSLILPVARIPSASPPGMVIGQDPPPGKRAPRGSNIALLVSSGSGTARNFAMPNITGLSYTHASTTLTELGLEPRPILVRRADAPLDIVLDQDPVPNTPVTPGTVVKFRIRSNNKIPGAWREASVVFTVPQGLFRKEVRIVAIGKDGIPFQLFPRLEDYEDGQPPKYDAGTRITQPLLYEEQVTVEIYLDGNKVKSFFFEGDAEPVVKDFDVSGGENSAPA